MKMKKSVIASAALCGGLLSANAVTNADNVNTNWTTNDKERVEYNQPYSYETGIDPTGKDGLLPETVALHDQPGSVTTNTSSNASSTNSDADKPVQRDNGTKVSNPDDDVVSANEPGMPSHPKETISGSLNTNNSQVSNKDASTKSSTKDNSSKDQSTKDDKVATNDSTKPSTTQTINSQKDDDTQSKVTTAEDKTKDNSSKQLDNNEATTSNSNSNGSKNNNSSLANNTNSNSINNVTAQNSDAYSNVNKDNLPETGESNHSVLYLLGAGLAAFVITKVMKKKQD